MSPEDKLKDVIEVLESDKVLKRADRDYLAGILRDALYELEED